MCRQFHGIISQNEFKLFKVKRNVCFTAWFWTFMLIDSLSHVAFHLDSKLAARLVTGAVMLCVCVCVCSSGCRSSYNLNQCSLIELRTTTVSHLHIVFISCNDCVRTQVAARGFILAHCGFLFCKAKSTQCRAMQ